MTSKERVMTAVRRAEPDRVPLDLLPNRWVEERLHRDLGTRTHRELLERLLCDVVDLRGVVDPVYRGPLPPVRERADGVREILGKGGGFILAPCHVLQADVPGHQLASGVARGAAGAYSNVACLNPAAAQRWTEQMARDLPAAREVEARLRRFMSEHIAPFITEQGYCNAACDRLMACVGGWADVGWRMRWPYRSIPAEEALRLRPVVRELIPEFA
jgi:hypothetical protein